MTCRFRSTPQPVHLFSDLCDNPINHSAVRGSGGGVAEEGKRGVRGASKRRMTVHKAWGWQLHEMREAAMMDDPMLDEILDDRHSAPTVPDFTPINRLGYSDTAPVCPKHEDAVVKDKSVIKSKWQKSAATTATKSKTDASSKKTKRARTAAQLGCQDISQGLSRTKPTSSRDRALPVKSGPCFGASPFEQCSGWRRLGDTLVEPEVKPALIDAQSQSKPSGLADKYQAACANARGNVVNQATPPTPPTRPTSDEVEAEPDYNDQSHGQNFAVERRASSHTYIEPSIQKDPEPYGSIIFRDFGEPPTTQMSPPIFQDRNAQGTTMVDPFDPLGSMSDDFFELDDIKCGDYREQDDFVLDDECLDKVMLSTEVSAREETWDTDWRSQDFWDDTLHVDEQLKDNQPHWPRPIPNSDGLAIDDDGATLVASGLTDVSSPPHWTCQASCILSRVTGNADTDRTRMSEGSDNCFDDNELDDSLIDLMVDGSKSLQVTSPLTPAKRPLSPKLKWLSPKTYTPAKASQIQQPVPPTDDLHLVPVSSKDNVLPFMRPPFPKAVRDRSPVLGLTNRTVLRICFRIGEALNAAAAASRTNVDAVVELYARVIHSSREASGGYKQYFQYGDLFTDKSPYLNGMYTLWRGNQIWDNDSKELVDEYGRGKMVRVLGRIKKREPGAGQGPGVEMVVLSIWEVDWEDVWVAKGLACPKDN